MLTEVQYLCELASQRSQTIPPDGLFLYSHSGSLVEIGQREVDFIHFRFDFDIGRKPKPELILRSDSFLWGGRFVAETKRGFKFHLLQFPLHIFRNSRLSLGPFMSYIDLIYFLSLFSYLVVVNSDVFVVHVSLFLCVVGQIKHVTLFVLFCVVNTHRLNVNWVLWAELVKNVFRGFVLVRFLGLLPEASQVHSRLVRNFFSRSVYFLPFYRRLFGSFCWLSFTFRFDLRFFFFLLFPFGRHGIQNSRLFIFFFGLCGCQVEDVESFNFILHKSSGGIFILVVDGSRMLPVRFNDPLDKVERYV